MLSKTKHMSKLRQYFLYLMGLPKTLYFNLKYLPLKQAIKLPVLVSHRVWLKSCKGSLSLGKVRPGIIKIGFGGVSIFDEGRSRSIWHVDGHVRLAGKADFGHGSKIDVSGEIQVGDNFEITAESAIVCHQKISFGNNVLISWETLIMDCDFHKIHDQSGRWINADSAVSIGNDVWIGCRCLVLKGVNIADKSVVAASSTVSRSIDTAQTIIAGSPARPVKENISWEY